MRITLNGISGRVGSTLRDILWVDVGEVRCEAHPPRLAARAYIVTYRQCTYHRECVQVRGTAQRRRAGTTARRIDHADCRLLLVDR